MRKILTQKFFDRPTLKVAEELLGKYLVRNIGGNTIILMIAEVEAYDGFKDKASHARSGKTKRNYPMYGEAGIWYVYFTYGMHFMLNIVTGDKEYPAAVLIRGTDEIIGPARLTKFLKIDRRFSEKLANKKSKLWIEDRGIKISKKDVMKTPRIGVDHSGPIWSKKKYRFVIK